MAEIDAYLKKITEAGASDLHLVCGSLPKLRIHGELVEMKEEVVLTVERMETLLFEILDKTSKDKFLVTHDLDFAYMIPDVARFRCNYFLQKRGPGAVFRIIPTRIKSLTELKVPAAVEKLAHLQKGLVLVTGPTGSGKSTTLAAIIDLINSRYGKHILTIEDPVEFVHSNKKSLIRQREIGADTRSFANAMRAALREDVDVVLVGEMRDYETMALAITLAETGQLVFGTLHTNSAAKTIDRIVDVFPPDQQEQIRIMLADSLKGIVAQQLVPTKDGRGRVAVLEILFTSAALANVIREGKTQQITSIIQGGKTEGMQTIDSALMDFVQKKVIGAEEAYMRAQDKNAFVHLLQQAWMEAAGNGQVERVIAMLKEGFDVDSKDDSGTTGLMLAAIAGHASVVSALIEHNADANSLDNSGNTAVIRASMKENNAPVMKILIDAGADVNTKNNAGNTAIMITGSAGNSAAVETLLRAKAKTELDDAMGCTVLMRAAMSGHTKVIELLLKETANLNTKDKSERTALMYALEKNNPHIATMLIEAGADVNTRSKAGITPLMWASRNSPIVVEMLLKAGADVNATAEDGYTALAFALDRNNGETIASLIEAGANTNVRTRTGLTPLMWAARNNPALVRRLVESGADVNMKNSNGYTALRFAQEACINEAINTLLECGARE